METCFRVDLALTDFEYNGHLALCRSNVKANQEHPCDPTNEDDFYFYENALATVYNDSSGCGYDDIRGKQNYTRLSGVYATAKATLYSFKPIGAGKLALTCLLTCLA